MYAKNTIEEVADRLDTLHLKVDGIASVIALALNSLRELNVSTHEVAAFELALGLLQEEAEEICEISNVVAAIHLAAVRQETATQ